MAEVADPVVTMSDQNNVNDAEVCFQIVETLYSL